MNRKTITVHITKLSHEGRGIAQEQGKTHFILNALPTETVFAEITRHHAKYDEGIAREVLTTSPERTSPPCSYYLTCGGCSLQHLKTSAQIQFKETLLKEQLKHFGHCEAETILPPLQAETLGYRRKARLGVKYVQKKQKVLVGFRELNGRYIADLDHCPVLHPAFGKKLTVLSELIQSLSNFQHIPQIECAMGDEDPAIILRHLSPFIEEDLLKLIEFSKAQHIAVFLQSKGIDSIKKLWPEDQNDYLSYTLPEYQLTFQFHPTDFTQVNLAMNRVMLKQALALLALDENDEVLDLFCGIGNFSLPIAKFVKSVLGVEGSQLMVERAFHNARLNQITNAHFIAADLTQEFQFTKNLKINKVLIDPPRTGAFEVLPHILSLNSERIVYVSCNPSTFARDAHFLTEHGYRLTHAGVMDMFPHTQHVESMGLFLRK